MKPRDIELLSAYLDGQLSSSDSARLESRLKAEPELVSVMDDLRTARGYLRQLPKRRAPRNFTLTRKMVGQNPPLPRTYPVFRFTTAIATLLFFLTYGLNVLAPRFASQPVYGMGGGGGGDVELYSAEAPAMAEPAATEAPAEAPSVEMVPAPTMQVESTPAADTTREMETPVAKEGAEEAAGSALAQDQPQALPEPQPIPPLVPVLWQYVLLGVAFLGAVLMAVMRRASARRWK